jgi:KaiC/GvpD/RAD55 family RecA-like ATPase
MGIEVYAEVWASATPSGSPGPPPADFNEYVKKSDIPSPPEAPWEARAMERAKIGVGALDEITGGGFPRDGLILLAGGPGTGKTILSMRFLIEGAESGEPGVYAGFAEPREALIEGLSGHLGADLAGLEGGGKLRILDFTTAREAAISSIMEGILREIHSIGARRLVIDSYSAMAQAFQTPHDARIALHAILGRIVRRMGCTAIATVEVPLGSERMGLGAEEFVADGIIALRVRELDCRLLRELELVKMRWTRLGERKIAFTLDGGFRAFAPFKPKPIDRPGRFQPIRDPPGMYSTGSGDLDAALGGGVPRGAAVLLEISGKVSMAEYHLIVVPAIANFIAQGRAAILIPTLGVDAEEARRVGLKYGLRDEEIRGLLRVCQPRGLGGDGEPHVVHFDAKDVWGDYGKYLELEEDLMRRTGQPVMSVSGVDALLSYYDEASCERLLGQDAVRIRRRGSLGILLLKPGHGGIARRLGSIAAIHLRLTREHGCLLLYGVKPRTGLYAVEMDASRGYPLPRLTPIV